MRERERKIIVALVRDRPLAYAFDIRLLDQRTLTVGGSITVQMISSLTRLDLTKEEIVLYVVKQLNPNL